jgi:hypothetical protein
MEAAALRFTDRYGAGEAKCLKIRITLQERLLL